MKEYSLQNKKAWEYNAYDFWVRTAGTPEHRALEDKADPVGMLRRYARYFDRYDGLKVANICGSCGKKAVPLALLGSDVTVFDISEQNKKYALDLQHFHPFTKICDSLNLQTPVMSYFSAEVFEGEMAHARFYEESIRSRMPRCSYRKYTLSEIINAIIGSGLRLERFDEHPAWDNPALPGEFTAVAVKSVQERP